MCIPVEFKAMSPEMRVMAFDAPPVAVLVIDERRKVTVVSNELCARHVAETLMSAYCTITERLAAT